MKKITTFFATLFAALHRIWITVFQKILKIWRPVADYTYKSSDYMVKTNIETYRTFLNHFRVFKKNNNKHLWYKLTVYFLCLSLFVVGLTLFATYYLFLVPVGSSAVVTRFGKFTREVESGLNAVFPLIERYYIVNTGNLMEEPFGFRQGPRLLTPEQFNPQEKYVSTQYEAKLLRSESDAESPFSARGNFLHNMSRAQRLTHDYLRQKVAPPQDKSTQGILRSIQQKEAAIVKTKQANISLDGKIPVPSEMLFLTGDLGLIEMQWVLQYHIRNGQKYLFNSRDVSENIRDIAMAKMNEVIGETIFNNVMTTGRSEVENKVLLRTQKMLDSYNVGIKITQVIILNALPTPQVIAALNEVNKAAQDLERFRFQGEYDYMKTIPKAFGEATKIKRIAEAYALRIVNQALGETGRFSMVRVQYEKSPQTTKDRLYIVTMQEILRQTPNIILDKDAKGILPIFLNGTGLKNTGGSSIDQVLTNPSALTTPSNTRSQAGVGAINQQPAP